MFKKLLTVQPNDKTCAYYISLLEKFFVKGKYPTLQDDFGVAFNPENPSDMDKSWVGTEKEIKGKISLGLDVNAARSIRLDGQVREALEVKDNTISVNVGKGKIYTVEVL